MAIFGLKFPENVSRFLDENHNFDEEILWNHEIEALLQNFPQKQIPTNIVQQIQQILL